MSEGVSMATPGQRGGPFQGLTDNSLQNTKEICSYDLLIDRFFVSKPLHELKKALYSYMF
jgi:hypothetical protein